MGVVRVDCLCECDACQKRFGVEIELALDLPDYVDFEELVREELRGGNATCYTWGVRGKLTVDRFPLKRAATVQGDLVLCDVCTGKCDDDPREVLDKEAVLKILGLPRERGD